MKIIEKLNIYNKPIVLYRLCSPRLDEIGYLSGLNNMIDISGINIYRTSGFFYVFGSKV